MTNLQQTLSKREQVALSILNAILSSTRASSHSPESGIHQSFQYADEFLKKSALESSAPLDTKGVEVVGALLRFAESHVCGHDETHRGGTIWEICNSCGAKWADDRGGKPPFKWPASIERAREYLTQATK